MSKLMMSDRQMAGKPYTEQAKQAIRHTLEMIRDIPEVGWYLGLGTQSFALLTEAAATLWGEPVEKVREAFLPRKAADPSEAKHLLRQVLYARCPGGSKFIDELDRWGLEDLEQKLVEAVQ